MGVRRSIPRIELPLLKRELIEAAQRRRTYVLRVAVLFVFALIFLLVFASLSSRRVSPLQMLGSGRELTEVLFATISFSLYILLPAMACGAITTEKEKHTLDLLLGSKLTPGTIVLEKVASRVTPMLSLIVVSAPLFGLAYLMGGLSFSISAAGLLILLVMAVNIAAIAVCWSALLESSLSAFWWTYVTIFVVSFAWPFFIGRGPVGSLPDNELFLAPFYPIVVLTAARADAATALLLTLPTHVVTVVALLIARRGIARYSYGQPIPFRGWAKHAARLVFGALRVAASRFRWSRRLERWPRWLAGIATNASADSATAALTMQRPIEWRERRRSSLNRPATIVGFVTLQILLQLWAYKTDFRSPHEAEELSAFVSIGLLIVALLIVMGFSCRLFAGERERQTLDSLLTVPLSSQEILAQKLASVNRMCLLLTLPILAAGVLNLTFTNGLMRYWTRYAARAISGVLVSDPAASWFTRPLGSIRFLFAAAATAFLYMHLVKWIAVWFGLKQQPQMKAMLGSLLTVIGLTVIPVVIAAIIMISVGSNPDDFPIFCFMSPAIIPCLNEIHQLHEVFHRSWFPDSEWLVVLTNLAVYGSLAWLARRYVLSKLSSLLGRIEQPVPDGTAIIPPVENALPAAAFACPPDE